MKRFSVMAVLLLCMLALCACGSKDDEEVDENGEAYDPPKLEGQWKQVNNTSEEDYQGIYISEDNIQVYWILGSSDGAALYWDGTFTPPVKGNAENTYSWQSTADKGRTEMSLFASKEETHDFEYKNGKLIYTATYGENSMRIVAEQQEWGYETLEYSGTVDVFDLVNEDYQEMIAGGGSGVSIPEE